MSEFVVTDFELGEQIFIPAGDGEPAKWKLMDELNGRRVWPLCPRRSGRGGPASREDAALQRAR
jgi:hypothetical protein